MNRKRVIADNHVKCLVVSLVCLACVVLPLSFGDAAANLPAVQPFAPSSSVPATGSELERLPSAFLSDIERDKVSVSALVNGLGSSDVQQRRRVAQAAISLRDHYINVAQNIASRGYSGRIGGRAQVSTLDTLATLRPSSRQIVEGAAQHITFNWVPEVSSSLEARSSYRATAILIRSSLASLPTLSRALSTPLPSRDKNGIQRRTMYLNCVLSILGPASVSWLQRQADATEEPSRKQNLQLAASTAKGRWKIDLRTGEPVALDKFGSARELENERAPYLFKDANADEIMIQWQIPEKLSSEKSATVDSWTLPWTRHAARIVSFTPELIQYVIAQRLTLEENDRDKRYTLYPVEAQLDALRVLGCLRPVSRNSIWVIWQRLRERSLVGLIEKDASEDARTCLRALGQIDIPAARFLSDRIASEWADAQQRAAAFALSKIMGRYSVYFIKEEIDKRLNWIKLTKDKKDERELYQEQNKRLQAMLKVGTEKKWFVGEYYGYNDPHAYDLIFPDELPKVEASKTN